MAKTVSDLTHTGQVNSFTGGLNTDLHPLVQPNDTLTDCINGTLITYNGNENMLQNDMGNYALEGSELPDGFIPLGMKEHNGVAYIVSQNPMTKEVQIGSYPSPEIDKQNLSFDIDSLEIEMSYPALFDFDYEDLEAACCRVSDKIIPDPKMFDFELNIGDKYIITESEVNVDFQKEQFFIESEDGKITNVYPIVDGEEHAVNWLVCGKFGKKYVLNTISKCTQDVSCELSSSSAGISKIKIKNNIVFDDITVRNLPNGEVLAGVLYRITYSSSETENESTTKYVRATKVVTLDIDRNKKCGKNIEISVTGILTEDSFGPIYLLENDGIIIEAYPILIHQVSGKLESVLCYDNWVQTYVITEKYIKSQVLYQYYNVDPDGNSSQTIRFYLNAAPDKNYIPLNASGDENKKYIPLTVTYLTPNLDLIKFPGDYCIYKNGNEDYWTGVIPSENNNFVFIQFDYNGEFVTLPLFFIINEDKYNKYKDLYLNFCSIPGNLLWGSNDGSFVAPIDYSWSNDTEYYIKLHGSKIDYHKNLFNVYSKYANNILGAYGDVICSDLTISNIQNDSTLVELQYYNGNAWDSITKYTPTLNGSKITISNIIKNANVYQATQGAHLERDIDRVYLLKHGHALFAQQSTKNNLKRDVKNAIGCDDTEYENIYKYGNWDTKITLYLNKACGTTTNAVICTECDMYNNKKNNETTITSELQWNSYFNSYNQFIIPIKLHVSCRTACFWYPQLNKSFEDSDQFTRETWYQKDFYSRFVTTDTIPFLPASSHLYFTKNITQDMTTFDKWMFGLYSHTFYYNESRSSNNFHLINKESTPLQFRVVVNADIIPQCKINKDTFFICSESNLKILSELITHICYNFNFTKTEEYIIPCENLEQNKLWNIIQCYNQMKEIDSNNTTSLGAFSSIYYDKYEGNGWKSYPVYGPYTNLPTELGLIVHTMFSKICVDEKGLYINSDPFIGVAAGGRSYDFAGESLPMACTKTPVVDRKPTDIHLFKNASDFFKAIIAYETND